MALPALSMSCGFSLKRLSLYLPHSAHAFGSLMSKYLERMAKSNDQILKLAEIIAKEQEKDTMSNEDIFDKIMG